MAAIVRISILVFGTTLIGLTVWLGWSSNHRGIAEERRLIDNALAQAIAGALDQQRSVAWWDDAVRQVALQFDQAFVDANFGYFLTETYQQDAIYILDGGDRIVYEHHGESSETGWKAPTASHRFDQLMPVVDAVRRRPVPPLTTRPDLFMSRQSAYNHLTGLRENATWSSAILLIENVPAIVTAMTIRPNIDLSLTMDAPYVLVSVVAINEAFLKNLGDNLLIPNLTLTSVERSGGALVSQPFLADDGRSAGYLTWRTAQPGQPILTIILPLVSALSVLGGLLANRMLNRIGEASAELQQREAQARHDALHDDLSRLPNRLAFHQHAARHLGEATATGRRVVVGYLDIDRFKDVNDTLGHHKGDQLIRAFGSRLRTCLPPDVFVARIGGDEFAILREAEAQAPADVGALVAAALATPLRIEDHDLSVTSSVGLVVMPEHGTTLDELTRHADIALYEAKRQGRNRAVMFDAAMAEDLSERHTIEVELRNAIRNDELELYYQPLVDVQSGQIHEVEALLRWFHPVRGAIPPSVFVPIAEDTGLMTALGDWVLGRAVAQARGWPDISVAVNLSPVQFRYKDLCGRLLALTGENGVDPHRIVLEVTEGLLLDLDAGTRQSLDCLRKAGFRIALDDFGTGFSSLRYLLDIQFDKIKIDRSFISGTDNPEAARTIVRSIVEMGHALGSRIVAEGVETDEERRMTEELGCDQLQGYHYSRPLPGPGLAGFIASFNSGARLFSGAKPDARHPQAAR